MEQQHMSNSKPLYIHTSDGCVYREDISLYACDISFEEVMEKEVNYYINNGYKNITPNGVDVTFYPPSQILKFTYKR